MKKRKNFWAEAIRNLRKARDQVACRYNAVRKTTPFKVGDVVVYRVKVLSSKGKGVPAKLELKWSKPIVIAKFFKPNVVLLATADTGVGVKKAQASIKKITPGWELSGSRQVMAGGEGDFPKFGNFEGGIFEPYMPTAVLPAAVVASPTRMSKHAVLCSSWKTKGTSGCNQNKGGAVWPRW